MCASYTADRYESHICIQVKSVMLQIKGLMIVINNLLLQFSYLRDRSTRIVAV